MILSVSLAEGLLQGPHGVLIGRQWQQMNIVAVAERVEFVQALLERVDCDFAQGYLHAAPLDPGELESWLREHAALEASEPARERG